MSQLDTLARLLLDNGVLVGLAALVAAAGTGLGTVLGVAGGVAVRAWLGTRQQMASAKLATTKAENEFALSQDRQALAIFKTLVDSLMPRIVALERDIKELTRRESECREQNAALQTEVKALRADNASLRQEMADLKGDLQISRAEGAA